ASMSGPPLGGRSKLGKQPGRWRATLVLPSAERTNVSYIGAPISRQDWYPVGKSAGRGRAGPFLAGSPCSTISETMGGRAMMAARVPMVSLERAAELGEAMGMPARRTQSEAFRTLANNPGVARVAYTQLVQLL